MMKASLIPLIAALLLPATSMLHAQVVTEGKEPELKKLGNTAQEISGVVKVKVNGQNLELFTTRVLNNVPEERINAAPPEAQKILRSMQGKTIVSATLRKYGENTGVEIAARMEIAPDGRVYRREERHAVGFVFELTPDYKVASKGSRITYEGPDSRGKDQRETNDVKWKLDSVVKHPSGTLSLKGSFSATFTHTTLNKKLAEPVEIEGTFDIYRAGKGEGVL